MFVANQPIHDGEMLTASSTAAPTPTDVQVQDIRCVETADRQVMLTGEITSEREIPILTLVPALIATDGRQLVTVFSCTGMLCNYPLSSTVVGPLEQGTPLSFSFSLHEDAGAEGCSVTAYDTSGYSHSLPWMPMNYMRNFPVLGSLTTSLARD